MSIICPSCATSYMLDPAMLGPAGRTVRCARCKATWFASGTEADNSEPQFEIRREPNVEIETPPRIEVEDGSDVTVFINSVIAEGEAEATGTHSPGQNSPPQPSASSAIDDFGEEGVPVGTGQPRRSEYEEPAEIDDAPSLVPPREHAETPEFTSWSSSDTEAVESFAARRQRAQARSKKARHSSPWTAVALVLLAFNVAFVGARNEVVRYLPQAASLFTAIGLPVNLRHLNFENVQIVRKNADGASVLVVRGAIVNTARQPIEVPRLRFAARNKAGREIYTWTMLPTRNVLQPGERTSFTSRLASPPKDAYDVMVRFFTANDAMAGGK